MIVYSCRMNPLAWLIGLVLPACGFPAAEGLPAPPPMDVAHIVRPSSPNTALAAPEGFTPRPDVVTPHYQVPAGRLFALVQDVAAGQPRDLSGRALSRSSFRSTTSPAVPCSISPT